MTKFEEVGREIRVDEIQFALIPDLLKLATGKHLIFFSRHIIDSLSILFFTQGTSSSFMTTGGATRALQSVHTRNSTGSERRC
jgi:hypothetical protein